jgi:hypothetical protein
MRVENKVELEMELGYAMINLSNERGAWLIGRLENDASRIELGERVVAEVNCTADGCRLASLIESPRADRIWVSGKIVGFEEPSTILFSPDPQTLASLTQSDLTTLGYEAGITKLVACSYNIRGDGGLEFESCRSIGEVARQPVRWK